MTTVWRPVISVCLMIEAEDLKIMLEGIDH